MKEVKENKSGISACPFCKQIPFMVEWEEGTFDFNSVCCDTKLEPDAETLIKLLEVK